MVLLFYLRQHAAAHIAPEPGLQVSDVQPAHGRMCLRVLGGGAAQADGRGSALRCFDATGARCHPTLWLFSGAVLSASVRSEARRKEGRTSSLSLPWFRRSTDQVLLGGDLESGVSPSLMGRACRHPARALWGRRMRCVRLFWQVVRGRIQRCHSGSFC